MVESNWCEVARRQQHRRDQEIPEDWILQDLPSEDVVNVLDVPARSGIMTHNELAITEMYATSLLCQMATRRLTSYKVTLAFCKRAAIAQQVVNCLTQIFFEEALERATELDQILQQTGKPVGRYHGLPFSIKDHIDVAGKESSAAFVSWVGTAATEDAPIVKLLRAEGAVFFVKTNNPQTLMHLETESNVFGRTLNPCNRNLTAGGSSGGEGALVGMCGSPIGLGGDGGGSIRSPAANQGLYGLKPTSGRVPVSGCKLSMPGCNGSPVVLGPICRSARDCEYFMETVLATEPWRTEPGLVPLPWRKVATGGELTIGIYDDDGVVRPHPPILAAIAYVATVLRSCPGIKIVPWKPFRSAEGYALIQELFFPDGGAANFRAMNDSGEPVLPLSAWVMRESHTRVRSNEDNWALNVKREQYRRDHLRYWNEQHPAVDVVLGPAGPSAAPGHGQARYWGYTAVWNVLDLPACTVPTGLTCSPACHPKDPSYVPRDNKYDAYNWNNYDPATFAGAPLCFQVIGRPWECERVVEAAKRISAHLAEPRPRTRLRAFRAGEQ